LSILKCYLSGGCQDGFVRNENLGWFYPRKNVMSGRSVKQEAAEATSQGVNPCLALYVSPEFILGKVSTNYLSL
jgi:hypothetical protein